MKKIVFVLVIACALGFLFSLETLARKVAPGQGCAGAPAPG